MEIRIVANDKEIGEGDNFVGTFKVDYTLNGEATGYDVIKTIVKIMEIVEYHPITITKALEEVLEERKSPKK